MPKPHRTRSAGTENGATIGALSIIAAISTLGFVASFVYGKSFSTQGAILATLASLLGYAVGGLGGFLFGFPRYTEGGGSSGNGDPKANGSKDEHPVIGSRQLNANTNLEKIVDWLTTIIVGATLVNVREVGEWGARFSLQITQAVQGDHQTQAAMPGALLMLPFMIGGFLLLYLWARRYLLPEWSDLDHALAQIKRNVSEQVKDEVTQEVKSVVTQEVQVVKDAAAQGLTEVQYDVQRLKQRIWPVGLATLDRIRSTLMKEGVAPDVIEDIVRRYREAGEWDSEPMSNFGASSAGAYRIVASAKRSLTADRFEVHAAVEVDPTQENDFKVAWLLHNTFDEPVAIQESEEARSGYEFWVDEEFVLGALVIEKDKAAPATWKLSLDLATLPIFASSTNEKKSDATP